jgi:putrescine importer
MSASEGHGSQAHHGTLQKQLNLRSLVLFGLADMTPIIVFGIFGVIAELSDGGSAGSYLLATVAMLFTALSYGLMAKHFPVAGSAYTCVRKALDSRLGFVVGWAILLDYLFLPLVIWLIGGS